MLGMDLDPLRLPPVLALAPRLYPSLAAVLALCAACGEGGRGEVPEGLIAGPVMEGTTDSVTDGSEVDLDVLRALPYAGYREEASGEEQRSGVVLLDEERSHPGFNLYSAFRLASAFLIDARGEVVRSWSDPDGYHWARCRLLPGGDLLVVGSSQVEEGQRRIADAGRYLAKYAWSGALLWRRALPVHHDVEVLPDGRLAVLGYRYAAEPAVHAEAQLRDDVLLVLSADGEVQEEHSLYGLLSGNPEVLELKEVKAQRRARAFEVELFHSNSIEHMRHAHLEARDPLYAAGNVLVSMRHQDAVAIVDPEAGRAVWSWGRGKVLGPHSATVLASGNVLIFDNGLGRGWSRSVEVDPVSGTVVWRYHAPRRRDFYTASRGSNQRLANGNTLLTDSDNGNAFEVTPEGERVWEFWAPHHDAEGRRATLVQTERYDVAFVERILAEVGSDD